MKIGKYTKLKKGIGGLLFILVMAIGAFTLNLTIKFMAMENTKYIVNSTAYFCANKSAVNLYNTNAPSGTYTMIPRILKPDYNPLGEFNSMLQKATESKMSGYSGAVEMIWDRDTKTLVAKFGSVTIANYEPIFPNVQEIVIEK